MRGVVMNRFMRNDDWRKRLRAAIADRIADGKENYTSLAVKAGKGVNFVQQYVKTDRAPSIENLMVLGEILNVSPIYILSGLNITPEDEHFLHLLANQPPQARAYLRKLLEEWTHQPSVSESQSSVQS